MTSKSQKHSIVGFLQLSEKKSAWRVILGIALGVLLVAPAQAAVFTVNTAVDFADANPGDGVCDIAPPNLVCTLRAAIMEANALAGADQIILPPNTYLLTIVSELTITDNLTITGGGASTTIIDGNRNVRSNSGVLVINVGFAVNLSGVTIRNGGEDFGGGIFNNGTLTLTNSKVSDNSAGSSGGVSGSGGGILNGRQGTLTVTNSTVSDNSSGGFGGGIANDGTLTLTNSTVSGNNDGGGGDALFGGGIFNNGTLTLTNSTVSGNRNSADAVGGRGGGIYNGASGILTLTNSTVSGNSAADSGGGIFNQGTANLFNATVSDNGDEDRVGGGILNVGTLTLTNSTVNGNSAFAGGGIFNDDVGALTLTNSTVSDNSVDGFGSSGGGIVNVGTLTLTNSTVSDNSVGGVGGGIANVGTLTLTNSTVSANSATNDGGGILNVGIANLFNATITNNVADAEGDGFGIGAGVFNATGATFNFQNTILAGNFIFRLGPPVVFIRSDCVGSINSNGNNLMQSVVGCMVAGGGVMVDVPNLGPLQNNGGPTQTQAPLAGSRAIDGGNPSGCRDQFGALLLKDQRGFPRTVDGNRDRTATCDIGAVEFVAGVTFYSDVDFDGDGRNDIGVYREGTWFILRSMDGGVTATPLGGLPQDIPVPGDYDGDGKTDVAVYRDGAQSPTQALWFIKRSSDGGIAVVQWGGLVQDIPVPGDYDGDGKTDMAVYRDGTWFILRSFDGGVMAVPWGGLPQDVPVPADYDGDRRTDIAVYRDGVWFILLSSGGVLGTGWGGLPQDVPAAADYDGDGRVDLAVYRGGTWFILRSSDGGVTATDWGGLTQDVAVPGDYDGDGKADVAVYRDGVWFVLQSSNGGVTQTGWGGLTQDIPLNRRND